MFYAVCLSLACAVPVFNIICSNKQFNGNNNNSNNAVLISSKEKKDRFLEVRLYNVMMASEGQLQQSQ